MKVGDLVRHWRHKQDIGVVIEKERRGSQIDFKVLWAGCDDTSGWYSTDRLELMRKK